MPTTDSLPLQVSLGLGGVHIPVVATGQIPSAEVAPKPLPPPGSCTKRSGHFGWFGRLNPWTRGFRFGECILGQLRASRNAFSAPPGPN